MEVQCGLGIGVGLKTLRRRKRPMGSREIKAT